MSAPPTGPAATPAPRAPRATESRPTASIRPRAAALPRDFLEGRYRVGFARERGELDEALALRFEVFNRELREGLEESWLTGRDEDEFDAVCDHLLLRTADAGKLVGTYRMQPIARAAGELGLYSAREFDLGALPERARERGVELGRACIDRSHRSSQALFALWRGLAAYVSAHGLELLAGCSSLTSRDPAEGLRLFRHLAAKGLVHPRLSVAPLEGFECRADGEGGGPVPAVPKLFATYLRYGAKVCGPPAIDRCFGTIDFFTLLDLAELDPRVRAMFFGSFRWA